MNKYWLALMATAIAVPAMAYERQHESHEHGAATMRLVIEEDALQLQIETPAMNIVGFEHAPTSEAQHQAVHSAETLLGNPDNVVVLPAAAQCHVTMVSVENSLPDEAAGEHDAADHHHEGEHEHDDHDESVGDADHEEGHSDFDLGYAFECGNIDALKQLDVKLFSHFPLLEELEVQYIVPLESGSGQGVQHLSPTQPLFKF
ncbi:DUF2796 domain-containing protein [Amphritea sp.]|uniref:DUF2796 domain-containing protein n=1 Tax=Amphritea sp. TaxID=1872502 RepID=UPI003A95397D